MKTLKTVTMAVMAALVLLTAGSALAQQNRYGDAIDAKAQKVTLAQLVAKPDAYAGKLVVVEGTHGGACSDGADFYFKDKFDIIEVDPPAAASEVVQLKKGTPVRLYGIVKVRHSGSAEAAEKGEKGEKKEAGEAEVRIAAKGVEVK